MSVASLLSNQSVGAALSHRSRGSVAGYVLAALAAIAVHRVSRGHR